MPQHPVEVILAKQLASHLAMPIFIVDPFGRRVFYNQPAELLLGHRFDETGEMPVDEWGRLFQPTGQDGTPLAPEDLPLVYALEKRVASHRRMCIRGLDGIRRELAITAFPIDGEGDRHLVRSPCSGKHRSSEGSLLGCPGLAAVRWTGHGALRRQHLVRRGPGARPRDHGPRCRIRAAASRRGGAGGHRAGSTSCSRTSTSTTSWGWGSSHRCSDRTSRCTSGGPHRRCSTSRRA